MASGARGQKFESSFRQKFLIDISFIWGNEPNGEQKEQEQQLK